MTRIAILGNGPAAAYCYRACLDAGAPPPDVYGQGRPTFPSGAFWLHWLPPSVNADQYQMEVHYRSTGSAEEYSRKMWGEVYPTSFPTTPRIESAFHPGALYDLLWRPVPSWKTVEGKLGDADTASLARGYDLVFQSFPTELSQKTQPARAMFPILSRPEANDGGIECVYNGLAEDEWVRWTRGMGRVSFEFPPSWKASGTGSWVAWMERKFPDMHPSTEPDVSIPAPNIVLIGRHARWDRQLLGHSSYEQTLEALRDL